MKKKFGKYLLLIYFIFFPFTSIADKIVYECRFYVDKLKRYHTTKIILDTWAMNGTMQNTTPFLKVYKEIRSGSLVKQKEAYMLTIDELPLLIENHLIHPIDGKLKYLIEVSYYNILGKTVEEKKQITNRIHLSGDCRIPK